MSSAKSNFYLPEGIILRICGFCDFSNVFSPIIAGPVYSKPVNVAPPSGLLFGGVDVGYVGGWH